MRPPVLFLTSLITSLITTALAASAQVPVHEHGPTPPSATTAAPATAIEGLSPDLRALFRQEMVGLQGSMLELMPAVVAADWDSIARVASSMQAGYVLAQRLTAAQRQELERTLPPAFLERDAEFHQLAGALAAAARDRRLDLLSFHVYKLTDSCVGCHARHATARFPAFVPARPPAAEHQHGSSR